jgi:uncharacterized protein (TIGR02466 family)
MILNLFSLPIYKVNILDQIDTGNLEEKLQSEFARASSDPSGLEKNGGVSTYDTNCNLHLEEYTKTISNIVLQHARLYWKVLDVDPRLEPRIDQCWSNIHYNKSITIEHSHSLYPIVATLYVKSKKHSGDLVLINPMEYGITHIPYGVAIENKTETSIKVSTGDLVLFPGWIRHKTTENLSDQSRIVLSFNIHYQGTYLASNSDYLVDHTAHTSEIDQLQNKILKLEFIIDHMQRSLKND